MTNTNQYTFSVNELEITTQNIANYITGKSGNLPDIFLLSIKNILQKISEFEISIGYKTYNAELDSNKLSINNIDFFIGYEVGLLLKNSNQTAIFACTVGNNFGNQLVEFNEIEDSYLIDIIGTVVIEKSIDKLLHVVQKEAGIMNLKTTNTISPGNCGWPINEQEKLFRLLPDAFLGIKLNSSGMMNPVKSISGIIGIGKNVSIKHTECEFCASNNCLYRKAPYQNNNN